MPTLVPAIVLCASALLAATVSIALPTVDAGADQRVTLPEAAQLDGDVQVSPIEFWLADGDAVTEDHLLVYHSAHGIRAVGPLETRGGLEYGWPSDLLRVGPVVYGVDTAKERIYELDETTGVVTPISPPLNGPVWDTRLGSLAHDPARDVLYSVDWFGDQNDLYAFDLPGLTWSLVVGNLDFKDVRGLAWDAASQRLLLYDADEGEIHEVDPATGTTRFVVKPDHSPGDFYDELTLFRGELYGALHIDAGGKDVIQVRRIDRETGQVEDIGPRIVDSDGHSLVIQSLPQEIRWTVDAGPGGVVFSDETDPDATARFAVPGRYVLRLTALADPPVSDTIALIVADVCDDAIDGAACSPSDAAGCGCGAGFELALLIPGLSRWRRRRRGPRA